MNLKDLVDKLASLDNLEKLSTQMDKKIPGEQPTMDPKADVNAMTQALAAIRTPQMSPNTVQQPQQATEPEAAPQDTAPPEKQELQQKNKPGEPIGEEALDENAATLEKIKNDPDHYWTLDQATRNSLWSQMDPKTQRQAVVQQNLRIAMQNNDTDAVERFTKQRDELSKPQQSSTDSNNPPKADSKDQTTQSASQEDIDAQEKLTQQLGQAYAQVMRPDSGQSEAGKAAVRKSYEEAAAKLDAMKGKSNTAQQSSAGSDAASAKPSPNLGSGGWYRGKEGDYTIQPGDTLSSISKRTGVPLSQLMRMNNIENPNKIIAGAKLKTGAEPKSEPKSEPTVGPTDTGDQTANVGDADTGSTTSQTTNPYTGADAEKFASLTPQDQAWLTKGGGTPDINDPNILRRAPNRGQSTVPQQEPSQQPATTAAPTQTTNNDDLRQQAATGNKEAQAKIAAQLAAGTEKNPPAAQASPVTPPSQIDAKPIPTKTDATKQESIGKIELSLEDIVNELLGKD